MTISEERRLVTVLFVDLVGFTTRAEQTRASALATFEQLRAGPYVERARQVAQAG